MAADCGKSVRTIGSLPKRLKRQSIKIKVVHINLMGYRRLPIAFFLFMVLLGNNVCAL
jgi:hypothetical protein